MHKKNVVSVCFFSVLFLFVGTALFTACDNAVDPGDNTVEPGDNAVGKSVSEAPTLSPPVPLQGAWVSYDTKYEEVFDIASDYIGYYVDGDLVFDGDIVDVILDDSSSIVNGIIYLQYINAPYGIPGNFYAVRWTELAYSNQQGTSVRLSACSDEDGKKTLPAAEAEYTAKSGYFDEYSNFTPVTAGKKLPLTIGTENSIPKGRSPIAKYFEDEAVLTD
jgi:hypothetical protein